MKDLGGEPRIPAGNSNRQNVEEIDQEGGGVVVDWRSDELELGEDFQYLAE